MKKYAFTFRGRQSYDSSVTKHNFILRCMPGTFPFQRSYAHKLTVTPTCALTYVYDANGNEMATGAVDKRHKSFSFEASGFVLCSKYIVHEPLDRLFLYPSRITRPTEGMRRVLSQAPLSEDSWARARQLCDLVHRVMTLEGQTGNQTVAAAAFSAGRGDSKDFAQVLVTLCRATGIAARVVNGLALGIPTAHCWTEVFCGNLWRALDPTTGKAVEEGYLKIAQGQDWADCAMFQDVYRTEGAARSGSLTMQAEVTEHVITARQTNPHA